MNEGFTSDYVVQRPETTRHEQKNPEFVPKTKTKHAKIVVMKHGTSYVEKDTELCACPECGSVDIAEDKNSTRKTETYGCIVNKTTITHGYRCSGCGCEFNTNDVKRKIHRVRGGLGLVLAIVLFTSLVLTIIVSQVILTSNAKRDAAELLDWQPALRLTLKAVIPNIASLFLIDYHGISEDLEE